MTLEIFIELILYILIGFALAIAYNTYQKSVDGLFEDDGGILFSIVVAWPICLVFFIIAKVICGIVSLITSSSQKIYEVISRAVKVLNIIEKQNKDSDAC